MALNDVPDRARELGADHGRNAAGWVFDGNSERAAYVALLSAVESGDDTDKWEPPQWLSGEWSGDPTPQTLADDLGLTDPDDVSDAADAYCDAADDAYWVEVERIARAALEGATS